ncbi:hypothetical protein CRG98_018811 [Punica granatum]|uniref:Uncharacterized protein n=1 Tax=Punica granatum TaxID=22663 RepID=A0A2I0JX37_PUNGR|nr:hypothetical protein CRG98_018811 [Punica granatum]
MAQGSRARGRSQGIDGCGRWSRALAEEASKGRKLREERVEGSRVADKRSMARGLGRGLKGRGLWSRLPLHLESEC